MVLGTVWLIYKAFVLDEPRLVDRLPWTDTTVTAFNSAGVALWTHNPEPVRDRTAGILTSVGGGSGRSNLPAPGEGILQRLLSLPFPFLFVSGSSMSRDAGTLTVLDALQFSGTSPEESGSSYDCSKCVPGRPVKYFVFPRSDVNVASEAPVNHARYAGDKAGERDGLLRGTSGN